MMNRLITGLFLLAMTACGQTGHRQVAKNPDASHPVSDETVVKDFPMPELPAMLMGENDIREYLVTHFWDRFDFSDSLQLENKPSVLQGLANFVTLSREVPEDREEVVRAGIETLCKGITAYPEVTDSLKYYVEEYLYNPNSPYYNENLYGIYLENMIAGLGTDNPQVSSYRFRLELIRKNRIGTKAEDFVYYLPNGTRSSLYATPVQGNRLVLVFYDPECHSCHDILAGMFADEALRRAVVDGAVTVLAVHTEDDEAVWKKYLNGMPCGWIIGQDKGAVRDKALYDLKAMPTIYLLDKDKKVILKDAPYEVIRQAVFE